MNAQAVGSIGPLLVDPSWLVACILQSEQLVNWAPPPHWRGHTLHYLIDCPGPIDLHGKRMHSLITPPPPHHKGPCTHNRSSAHNSACSIIIASRECGHGPECPYDSALNGNKSQLECLG